MDPRALKPAELVTLVNNAGLGQSLGDKKLRAHKRKFGVTRGAINVFQYAAWLVGQIYVPSKDENAGAGSDATEELREAYERKKRRELARSSAQTNATQEIGDLPKIANSERRKAGLESFQTFCETYFGEVFSLKWSPDHLKVIQRIETAVTGGGLFAVAMPRGSGKSSLCQVAVVWAALKGAHQFICLVAASADRADAMLENIKVWLETNPILMEDFPEVCYPIAKLERISHRQKGQKYKGVPTRIEWGSGKIVLPTIPDSVASGTIIRSSGMKGSEIRGQSVANSDGSVRRPSLVLVDDPQTSEAAWSKIQCQRLESIIAGDILGMAGPGKKIAGLLTCTVIRPDDLADNVLDREKHPEWHGERTKLLYSFPKNTALWDKYSELRSESFRNGGDGEQATDFYRTHREEMDEGAQAAWVERYNPDELSAIQHAINLRLRDEDAFFAEYQNDPVVEIEFQDALNADGVAEKLNGYPRGTIPLASQFVTAFIDVQDEILFWLVCAWEENFTGYIVDYGTFPDQKRSYFSVKKELTAPLSRAFPTAGKEARWRAGLEVLCDELISRGFQREDGSESHVEKIAIDANYGISTEAVYEYCATTRHAGRIVPSHGKFYGASSVPFGDQQKKPGDRIGIHWKMPAKKQRQVRHLLIDTNWWKSFLQARLNVQIGDPGSLSLFGRSPQTHRMIADHICAEFAVKTTAYGRSVDEWKMRPQMTENHWLDCLVGNAVLGSMCGAFLSEVGGGFAPKTAPVSFAAMQKQQRGEKWQTR